MPNFDGGHYFLTALFPIALDPVRRSDGTITAPSHLIREALAALPNASQAPGANRTSPFARCRRTHFLRLVVVDDPAFNGRDRGNAIIESLMGTDLLAHQPVDHLSRPWLLLAVDFDAADGSPASLERWAHDMWRLAEIELREIFRHCLCFGDVRDAAGFAAWLRRGQVETTMPFNDYWIDPPPLPTLTIKRLGLVALGALALVYGLGFALVKLFDLGGSWLWAAGLLALAAAVYAPYKLVMWRGSVPFATAPNSDLPSVLKAVYLQQRFTSFAIANQGADPASLHAAFGRFLAVARPADSDTPTQAPGVFRS